MHLLFLDKCANVVNRDALAKPAVQDFNEFVTNRLCDAQASVDARHVFNNFHHALSKGGPMMRSNVTHGRAFKFAAGNVDELHREHPLRGNDFAGNVVARHELHLCAFYTSKQGQNAQRYIIYTYIISFFI